VKILLDTHAVYRWTIGSDRLSRKARLLIEDKANIILVSAVSFYELDNRMRLKKLDLKPQELRAAVTRSGLQTLAISDLHAVLAATFDWEHRDHGTGSWRHRRGWSIAHWYQRMSYSTLSSTSGCGERGTMVIVAGGTSQDEQRRTRGP
jgi:PIN domain nuclease of toxin-antitoxin system